MDGASGQQTTRQKWLTETITLKNEQSINTVDDEDKVITDTYSDSAVFVILFVPIQLMADNNILWKNKRPLLIIVAQ